jgi:uncharacterized Zn finger protein
MPPLESAGPACPKCSSTETERLPFGRKAIRPIFVCNECGHIWGERKIVPATRPSKPDAA